MLINQGKFPSNGLPRHPGLAPRAIRLMMDIPLLALWST
jgi:hypothetical protein